MLNTFSEEFQLNAILLSTIHFFGVFNPAFLKVNAYENEDVAGEYDFTGLPTFIFFKGGEKVAEMMGAKADKLRDLLTKHK